MPNRKNKNKKINLQRMKFSHIEESNKILHITKFNRDKCSVSYKGIQYEYEKELSSTGYVYYLIAIRYQHNYDICQDNIITLLPFYDSKTNKYYD